MLQLKPQLHPFEPECFGEIADLLDCAQSGSREILMIACSDHGLSPDCTSFASPGQLCVIQNMAASIPPTGELHPPSTLASIEYVVEMLDVRHIIVCGHLGCQVIRNWMKESGEGQGLSDNFQRDTRLTVDAEYPHATASQRINLMIREHTLFQITHLQSHAFIQNRLRADRLRLHAWIVDDNTARVTAYQPETGQFAPFPLR